MIGWQSQRCNQRSESGGHMPAHDRGGSEDDQWLRCQHKLPEMVEEVGEGREVAWRGRIAAGAAAL